MIKANELRIGNLVDYFGKYKIVTKIQKEGIKYYLGCSDSLKDLMNCYNEEDAYSAIPLSEEILLKVGFELSGSVQKIGYFRLIYEDGGKLFFYSHPMLKIELKYLHQLQNLYFTSTGNEFNTSQL